MESKNKKYFPSQETMKQMYYSMLKIRFFEELAVELFMSQQFPGFLHSYLGQEACAAGVCAALRDDDYITSTHRGHGHVIAKGLQLDRMMAELFAKTTGYCKGKGGSMHIADFSKGILGANGIVGGGIPIATGAAVTIMMKKTDQVAVTFFGDGASNQGAFYEAANLAAVWNLPIIYVCENNLYAVSTAQSRHQKITDISERAAAFGFPGVTAYGNDPNEVYQVASEAIDRARKGGGPTLLELKTYKWKGHYVGDPATYRPKEEVDEWMKKDPIPFYEDYLVKNNIMTKSDIEAYRDKAKAELDEATEFGRKSPSPSPEDALEDVY